MAMELPEWLQGAIGGALGTGGTGGGTPAFQPSVTYQQSSGFLGGNTGTLLLVLAAGVVLVLALRGK